MTVGNYSFNVQVTDSTGATASTASPIVMAVAPATGSNCNDLFQRSEYSIAHGVADRLGNPHLSGL